MIRNLKRLFHGRSRMHKPAPEGSGRVRMNRDRPTRCPVCGRDPNRGTHRKPQHPSLGNAGCDPASRNED